MDGWRINDMGMGTDFYGDIFPGPGQDDWPEDRYTRGGIRYIRKGEFRVPSGPVRKRFDKVEIEIETEKAFMFSGEIQFRGRIVKITKAWVAKSICQPRKDSLFINDFVAEKIILKAMEEN